MKKADQIPTLEIASLDRFHFGNIPWRYSGKHSVFHINRLEEAKGKLSFPLPPHRKTVYDLLFLTKGESKRSKGLNQYQFHENQFFFLPAFQITSHENMSPDAKGFFLHFAPELFAENPHLLNQFPFLQFNTTPIISIPEKDIPPILNIFERLIVLYEKTEVKKDYKLIRWYLMTLFSEANQHVLLPSSKPKNSASVLTQQFKDALTQHIYQYRTVREYAQILHVTPNHLNKCVKKTLDKTAQTLLNEMLTLEAKSLLKYSNLSISQVAEQLCGSTPSNFARFFKNQTGLSPKDFVRQ